MKLSIDMLHLICSGCPGHAWLAMSWGYSLVIEHIVWQNKNETTTKSHEETNEITQKGKQFES